MRVNGRRLILLAAVAFCATFQAANGRRAARSVDINNVQILPFAPPQRVQRFKKNELQLLHRIQKPPIMKRCAVLKRKDRRIQEIHDEVDDLLRQIKQVDLPHVKNLLPRSNHDVQLLHRKLRTVLRKLSVLGRNVRDSKQRKMQQCRLVKLERKLGKARKKNRQLTMTPRRNNTSKNRVLPAENNRKLNAITMARNTSGDVGSYCKRHNDCKPGLCCHRAQPHPVCVLHALEEGSPCKHSCACKTQLHCFRSKVDLGGPVCKKATPDDVVNGVYENGKQAAPFDELQRKKERR
ncbi:hypothetical protein L596_012267 [Steinernema carpocapsae]|uniref:Dickkopf N-terminal cysteine-rich domain-containing protein n=1 Tax=Steinernema carpocapsae TaxID=34508 RepID=A0A4U5NXB4_STECR|nr:hypothetical protein L596_012267 [Steinernema carpocapsae]